MHGAAQDLDVSEGLGWERLALQEARDPQRWVTCSALQESGFQGEEALQILFHILQFLKRDMYNCMEGNTWILTKNLIFMCKFLYS